MREGVNIEYSRRFLRSLGKLPRKIQNKAGEREFLFISFPFDLSLHTHKLHGKDKEHWAYSVDNKYRIKFIFLDNHNVLYLDIGTHDDVY